MNYFLVVVSHFSFPNTDFSIAKYFCMVETPGSALILNIIFEYFCESFLPKRINKKLISIDYLQYLS